MASGTDTRTLSLVRQIDSPADLLMPVMSSWETYELAVERKGGRPRTGKLRCR